MSHAPTSDNNDRASAATVADDPPIGATRSGAPPAQGMARLVLGLVKPYRVWLAIVFIAMLVETAMTLATPWPLKIVIDNVVGSRPLPEWLAWIRDLPMGTSKAGLAMLAAILYVLIAALGAVASYIDNYYTESVGQFVANDLRMRVYNHLERLSLAYYDTHQTGTLLSTITDDVITIQDFASSATLTILIDLLTIIGILAVMFWLNWDFALIAVGVTPFLLFFVARFKNAVKKATHEVRRRQSDIVAVVQQGSAVDARRQGFWTTGTRRVATERGKSRHRRSRAQGPPCEVAPFADRLGHRGDVHRVRALAKRVAHPCRNNDGRRAHRVPGLPEAILQAGARFGENDQHNRAGGRWS